jgi:hypothetical protein
MMRMRIGMMEGNEEGGLSCRNIGGIVYLYCTALYCTVVYNCIPGI